MILSPSGLNAVMTGHSYKTTDCGISDILEEWKLFYPRRFDLDVSPSLPAAIEVVTGGVRMRYPSQVGVWCVRSGCVLQVCGVVGGMLFGEPLHVSMWLEKVKF